MEGKGKMRERTLPEYLRGLRKASRYKQDYVAAQLHITRQTYSHYETGRIKPPAGRLYKLAKLYGVPVEGMLAYIEAGVMEEGLGEAAVTAFGWEEAPEDSLEACVYHFRRLGEKDRMEIISLMKIKERINGQPEEQ